MAEGVAGAMHQGHRREVSVEAALALWVEGQAPEELVARDARPLAGGARGGVEVEALAQAGEMRHDDLDPLVEGAPEAALTLVSAVAIVGLLGVGVATHVIAMANRIALPTCA